MAAGSANALNCVVDADIDVMRAHRPARWPGTRCRPERVDLRCALGAPTVVLAWPPTWQAAVLAVLAILFYVFVYSLRLKRRTSQNIVWGGRPAACR